MVANASSPAPQAKKRKVQKCTPWNLAPKLPDGEDEVSYKRHLMSLKAEWSKRHPNEQFVDQLMKLTFAQRRQWILTEPRLASMIFEECPFLSSLKHVSLLYLVLHLETACMWVSVCIDVVMLSIQYHICYNTLMVILSSLVQSLDEL